MKVLIIDIDSKIQNYALAKIEKYHLDKGDSVEWNMPLYRHNADKVYVSCVFAKNKDKCFDYEDDPKCLIGGSGYSLDINLPEEIEKIKPKINLGFTTRGCIRKCEFCIVPQKEGKIRVECDLLDLWDGKSKDVVLMDNNIIALPKHFRLVCKQARENKIRLDFNQGLDIRLLTDDIARELNTIKLSSDIRFAWDNMEDENKILNGLNILKNNDCKRAMFYVLVGFNTTIDEDLYRLELLKSYGQRVYCMRYASCAGKRLYNDLSSWANQPQFFTSMDFVTFQKCRENRNLLSNKL